MRKALTFKFGGKHYTITSAAWEHTRHIGQVVFEDDDGKVRRCETWGMFPNEQIQACIDCLMDEARKLQNGPPADSEGGTE